MLTIGWALAYFAVLMAWVTGGFIYDFTGKDPWPVQLKREIHPFMPFLALANLAIITWGDTLGPSAFQYATTGILLAGWFMDRDDDDRWKRRRRKLAGKVARLGARLVVTSS